MNTTLRNLLGFTLLAAIVLAMACRCFGAEAENWLSQDANGWSQTPLDASARNVYVSSSGGSDSNDGLSEGAAKQTISAGLGVLRSGFGDHLLLKRGDIWTEKNTYIPDGKNATYPTVIGAYGTGARPIIRGDDSAPSILKENTPNYIAVIGIHLDGSNRTGSWTYQVSGTDIGNTGGGYILFENCKVSELGTYNLRFVGKSDGLSNLTNVVVRRNIIIDSWALSASSHSQGIFCDYCDDVLIEENIFDHNGWNDSVTGAEGTFFNHNIYLAEQVESATIRRNLLSRASLHGIKLDVDSGNHYIIDNCFARNGVAGQIGVGLSGERSPSTTGINVTMLNNVCVEGSLDSSVVTGNGMGWEFQNQNGSLIANNMVINRVATGLTTLAFSAKFFDHTDGVGIKNVTVKNLFVYNTRSAATWSSGDVSGDSPDAVALNNTVDGSVMEEQTTTIKLQTTGQSTSAEYDWSGGRYSSNRSTTDGWFTIFIASETPLSTTDWQNDHEADATFTAGSYTDSTVTATKFAVTEKGYADYDAWIADLAAQDPDNGGWDETIMAPALNDYLRAGFNQSEYVPTSNKLMLILK